VTPPRPIEAAGFGLTELLAPMTRQAFFSGSWGRRACALGGADPGRYPPLFSLASIDGYLAARGDAARRNLLCVPPPDSGRPAAALGARTRGAPALYRAFSRGDTLVFNALHDHWPPCMALAARLREALGAEIGINIYITPPHAQGFRLHRDRHDVFVLQLEGRKSWRVHPPPGPVAAARWERPGEPLEAALEAAYIERDLDPGDALYIPRGHPHVARTGGDPSVHATLGVHSLRWEDLLAEALRAAADDDEALQRALPIGLIATGEPGLTDRDTFAALWQRLAERVDLDGALDRLRRPLERHPPPPDGHFAALPGLDALDLDSPLIRREGLRCRVSADEDGARIHFGGHSVRGPLRILPELRFVAETAALSARDLPGALDAAGRLVLIRRLVREGLLRPDRR